MDFVRPWLAIGKYRDTRSRDALREAGVSAMLLLARDLQQEGIRSRYLAVEDGEALPLPLLAQGVYFVSRARRDRDTVLVACGAGISRSATFTIASLCMIEGLALKTAYIQVKATRPIIKPHPKLWDSLCEFLGERVGFRETYAWDEEATR
ncbi:MAG: dual specificity protein phosphatase family protein [Myxococcales bacterium]|nr:dual specificity protein phosphatase family protein [Myxococcales bacterium]